MRTEQPPPGRTSGRPATLYDLLGVSPGATTDAIKKAYRRKARELHPDANPGDPTSAQRFDEATAAYETLTDPIRRDHYDRWAGVAPTARRRPRRSRSNIFAPHGPEPEDHESAEHEDADPGDAGDPAPSTEAGGDLDPEPERPRVWWSDPVDLPLGVANGITAALLVSPVLWAASGFPGAGNRGLGDMTSWRGALALTIGVLAWLVASSLLWARSPNVPRQLSRWRSPGWDGTPLLLRVASFMASGTVATAALLPPALRAPTDGTQAWLLAAWALVLTVCWVASGQLPRRVGYRSRHDRYWGRPAATLRPRR